MWARAARDYRAPEARGRGEPTIDRPAENEPAGDWKPGRARSALWAAASFAFAGALLFSRLGALPLLDPDEGRNAEVAREMATAGELVVPLYNGLPYLDKPALYFDAVASSFALFGQTPFAARLPSALSAVGVLVLVFLFCRREYGMREAALAVAVIAGTPLFLGLGRYVVFDMSLALFVCAAVLAGYFARESTGGARRGWVLAGAAAAGAATLIKGPVGFLLPALVLVAFYASEGRWGAIRNLVSPAGLLVFLGLVLPWFLAVQQRRPDFARYGLLEESLRRFATSSFDRSAPFYYYVPVLFGVSFAWSALFPEAAVRAWRARRRWTSADRLLVVWTVVVVLFFSVSRSKLPGYVLTATIALGMLTARLFGLALANRHGSAAAVVRRGTLVLALASLAATAVLALESARPGTLASLGANAREIARLRPAFAAVTASLAALAALGFASWRLRSVPVALATCLIVPVSLLTVLFAPLAGYADRGSSRDLARAVERVAPGADVATLGRYPPGLAFYLRRTLFLVTRDGREIPSNYIPYTLARTARDEWPSAVVPVERLGSWLEARPRELVLLAPEWRRSVLDSIAARRGGRVGHLAGEWLGIVVRASEER